jgi:apolipoprotein D and lipocalin family protein
MHPPMNRFKAAPQHPHRLVLAALGVMAALVSPAATADTPPLVAVATLELERYVGTWYQVAWFPNRFQRQCVSDTRAAYRGQTNGRIEVINTCRLADGTTDRARGEARPVGALSDGQLQPAALQVSFLPHLLRWTGIGWGSYWVIQLADDYRYAVVSEPTREFLWVLSRTPMLGDSDRRQIREKLTAQGFDLERWQDHPHGPAR